jgi:parvulin-like peptidyl-prolyl isomerase
MRHLTRWIGAGLVGLTSMGCVATSFPGQPSARELAGDLMPGENAPVARMQRGDESPIVLAQAYGPPSLSIPNAPASKAPAQNNMPSANIAPPPGTSPPTDPSRNAPPPSFNAAPPSAGIAPAPSGVNIPPPPSGPGGAQQAGLRTARASRVAVRAWVNGRPIFDDEVILQLEMTNPAALRATSVDQATQAYNQALTSIIELEIAYQDAVRKLEKGNPTALDKLKEMVNQDYDKQARNIRKAIPDDKFMEIAPTLRRQIERSFIAMQYIQSRIGGQVNSVGYQEVKDYYDTHLNEFQKVESVKWQHAFIAVNPQRPTVADAKRVAQTIVGQLPPGGDFASLAKYDDGDSKTRGGSGYGSRKGEIQPPELEKYLFEMKDGQIGPMVEVSTGVHLFRLVQREVGGQVPLNESVQSQIRNKIRNQIFDREFKRFVRELKTRAVVEIERGV